MEIHKIKPPNHEGLMSFHITTLLKYFQLGSILCGKRIKDIELCGRLISKSVFLFYIDFILADHTGSLKLRAYIITRNGRCYGTDKDMIWELNSYYRVVGKIRKNTEELVFIVRSIEKITERNQVNFFISSALVTEIFWREKNQVLMAIFKDKGSNSIGLTSLDIKELYLKNMSIEKIEDCLLELLECGEIVNTIDFDHFSCPTGTS
ncbi:hypothetical protein SteCoe_8055 [Stentor coeruleus]|uniref:CST complex subunit Stn1 N-terminal domain-containing protein n=1 Tax=Stentor coeruleus TaxID=5963 RepID=A0A1R2CKZ7_9CILI|nr:hypothetical protein SteCoe_35088 [Stentor coeruleus]OMJ89692.1 hypothetical protein SteCoe_8055 [Stentor coeruleus]